MDADSHSSDNAATGKENILPVSKPAPAELPKEPIKPPIVPEKTVASRFNENTAEAEKAKEKKPLLVRVVADDELSSFESKTVKFGLWGMVIAALSLIAASTAAYLVFEQFKEMAAQTEISSRAAKQARIDAKDSSIAIAKQLALMQGQLTQQRNALQIDQRPWLKFELGGERPKDADPNNGKSRLLTTTAGQPIKVEVRVTNIGKTTAEKIFGTLIVQYVPKGGKPALPKGAKRIVFTEGTKPLDGSLPSTAWGEAVLYPNEVSQNSFSRSHWGKNGVIEDDPISQTEKAELDKENAYVLLLGQVWYSDMFGVRHWTKFCEMAPQLDLVVAKRCLAFGAIDTEKTQAESQP